MSDDRRIIACKWCGRRIVCNDAALSLAHEAPECDAFRALIAAAADAGIRPASTRVVVLDEAGREVEPAGTKPL